MRVPRAVKLQTVLRRGLTVAVRVRAPCRIGATAGARRGGTLVARTRTVVPGRRALVRLRAGRRTRAALRRRAPVRLNVRITARPPAGGDTATVSRRSTVRR